MINADNHINMVFNDRSLLPKKYAISSKLLFSEQKFFTMTRKFIPENLFQKIYFYKRKVHLFPNKKRRTV